MTIADDIQATCVVLGIERPGPWLVHARVISVEAKVPAERALVGVPLHITFTGELLPHLALRTGLLFRVALPLLLAEAHLDVLADRPDPYDEYDEPGLVFETTTIRPMAEPCVRVPLSLLRELRGFELFAEMTRAALIHVWSEDRRTGPND